MPLGPHTVSRPQYAGQFENNKKITRKYLRITYSEEEVFIFQLKKFKSAFIMVE